MRKTLYEVTGDTKDINTVLINVNELRELELSCDDYKGEIIHVFAMLAKSLDTNLMLSEKLTNAQSRWLGRQ